MNFVTFNLTRFKFDSKFTIGRLTTPRQTFFTMEDAVREVAGQPVSAWKIKGETAIPRGTYDLIIDMSARFKTLMPHILNVPGFEGIRIHAGSGPASVEGCIAIGWNINAAQTEIRNSRAAVSDFMSELDYLYDNNTLVRIEIK